MHFCYTKNELAILSNVSWSRRICAYMVISLGINKHTKVHLFLFFLLFLCNRGRLVLLYVLCTQIYKDVYIFKWNCWPYANYEIKYGYFSFCFCKVDCSPEYHLTSEPQTWEHFFLFNYLCRACYHDGILVISDELNHTFIFGSCSSVGDTYAFPNSWHCFLMSCCFYSSCLWMGFNSLVCYQKE